MDESRNRQIQTWKNSPEVRKIISHYSQISFFRSLGTIFLDWGVIFFVAYLCHHYFSWLLYLLSVLVIATRQHGLLVMVHEGAHFRLSNRRFLNDFISNFFAGFPTLMPTGWYRRHHADHHKFLNTSRDPDWARKILSPEWRFPQRAQFLFLTLFRQLYVGGFEWVRLVVGIVGFSSPKNIIRSDRRGETFAQLAFYIFGSWAAAYFGALDKVVVYWFVPLLTIFPLLQRIRSISEHFGLENSHELNSARNTLAPPLERFLVSPHNTNYHTIHHLFPSVPYFNLPKVHKHFSEVPWIRDWAHENTSYIWPTKKSVLKDLIG